MILFISRNINSTIIKNVIGPSDYNKVNIQLTKVIFGNFLNHIYNILNSGSWHYIIK